MTFKQYLVESGVLDDILGSFDSDSKESTLPKVTRKAPPPSNLRPRIIQSDKQDRFVDFYSSVGELKKLLNGKPITIGNIAKLYAYEYMAPRDNLIFDIPLNDVVKYREYDRSRDQDPERWDELRSDIKQNGIKEYSVINLDRLQNGNVGVLLGEGNHRLAIGGMLGVKTMPIYFSVKK